MQIRKVASNILIIQDKEFYKQHVVELLDDIMIAHYPLTQEIANTEWLGGTIIVDDNGKVKHMREVLSDG